MKKAGWIIVTGIGIGIVTACSGGASTPAEACNEAMSAICNKIYSCVDAQTITNTLGYTSAGDCITKLQAQTNCASQTCGQGRTYNAANANTCINDINTEACNQMTQTPPSCANTSICQ